MGVPKAPRGVVTRMGARGDVGMLASMNLVECMAFFLLISPVVAWTFVVFSLFLQV